MCALGIYVHGVVSVRSRGLGRSATIGEYDTALKRDYPNGRPKPAIVEFNHTNARLLRSSLLLYWAVVIIVWPAASYVIARPTMAFMVTLAAFIVARVFRIGQLKELPDIPLGFDYYVRTAFLSFFAVCMVVVALMISSIHAGFSWKGFWFVAVCLVSMSFMSVHADFVIAKLFRRPADR